MRSRIERNRERRNRRKRQRQRQRRMRRMPNLSGRRLGRYRLIRRIGAGGFSDVYLALHVLLKMHVIVKISKQEADEKHAFLTEARIAARLKHPHIINVIDYNHYRRRPYIVTMYAVRGTLHDVFRGEMPVPVSTVLMYLRPLTEALDYLHTEGYVHHDIKLTNIFLDEYNNVLLGDFGLAMPVGTTSSSNTFFATPTHASPERIMPGYVASPSADVYAVGVMLYQLLTGHLPFQGDDVLLHHLKTPPTSPRFYVPTLSVAVEQVVLKALTKRVEDRFVSAGKLFDALYEAYEQSNDIGTMRSTGYQNSYEDDPSPSNQNRDVLNTAFALLSYLFCSTLPAMASYLKGESPNLCWQIFALSVLCIPTVGALLRPNRRAKIVVLLSLLASTLIGFVAQNLLLAGTIQFMVLACSTGILLLYALFRTFE